MSESGQKWIQYLDALVGLSVVFTLIVLIVEVRGNSLVIERQIRTEHNTGIVAPLIATNELLSAYEKIKTRDGWEADIRAFTDHYGLEPREAIAWTRMLLGIWWQREIDYLTSGPSDELADSVRGLLAYPDNALFWTFNGDSFDPDFRAFVERQRELIPAEEVPVTSRSSFPSSEPDGD